MVSVIQTTHKGNYIDLKFSKEELCIINDYLQQRPYTYMAKRHGHTADFIRQTVKTIESLQALFG